MSFFYGEGFCVSLDPMALFCFPRSFAFYLSLPSFSFPSNLQGTPASFKSPDTIGTFPRPLPIYAFASFTFDSTVAIWTQVSVLFSNFPSHVGLSLSKISKILSGFFPCEDQMYFPLFCTVSTLWWGFQNRGSWFQMSVPHTSLKVVMFSAF